MNPGLCGSWVTALPLSYTLVSADLFIVGSCFVDLSYELMFQKRLTLEILYAEAEIGFYGEFFHLLPSAL